MRQLNLWHATPMSFIAIAVALASAFIAFVNGANDVSKGIATLAGSGVSSYRRAILWGALWTTIGSLAAFGIAGAMVATFGKGLLAPSIVPTLPAAIATILGAALWVGVATRFGLPVSTTHAIVGSIAGVATIAYGIGGMRWATLGAKVGLPLLLSPVASLVMTGALLQACKRLKLSAGNDCLCAEILPTPAVLVTTTLHLDAGTGTAVPSLRVVGCRQVDSEMDHPQVVSITVNHLHWLSSASASFARGLNDAPKMVALLVAATALSGHALGSSASAYLFIALGILAGSLLAGWRVTTFLSERITAMDHREGFTANLITASLVGSGAAFGLPMSTTHVASGAIIGVGLQRHGQINWHMVKEMILAWVVTLPAAALLGIVAYAMLRGVGIR